MLIILKKQGMGREDPLYWPDKIVDGPNNSD
jgi:hypothetical protein